MYAPYLTQKSKEIITSSPYLFAKLYIVSLGTFFLSDGYRLLWYELSGGAITLPNITQEIVRGNLSFVGTYFAKEPLSAIAFFVGFMFWGCVFLCATIGTICGLWSRRRVIQLSVCVCVVMVAYFALLTGPIAQARYRIVVTPFLFMLASYGGAWVVALYFKHFAHALHTKN
jgi:hypothetical protein